MPIVTQVQIIVILLTTTLAVALVAGRLRLPYTLFLVLVGLGLGFIHVLPTLRLEPDAVLYLFLPALLFEGAWSIETDILAREWFPVFLLAVPGLLVALGLLAVVLHLGLGVPWALALLLGAIVSPTDPIAVIALLRQLGLPERLRTLVEGESLFNDGVGAAAFTVILSFVIGHPINGGRDIALIIISTLWQLIGGPLLGAGLGFIAARLLRRVDDHLIETTVTFCVAYGVFVIGDAVHTSGLLAVVCAGLMMGSYGRRIGLTPESSAASDHVWEFAGYVANSLLFLVLGIQLGAADFLAELPAILWATFGVFAGRAVIIYAGIPLVNALASRFAVLRATAVPPVWRPLLLLSGLRGALSLALVLSLPADVPQLRLLRYTVYGVVLITLVGQGMGMRLLLPYLRSRLEEAPTPALADR